MEIDFSASINFLFSDEDDEMYDSENDMNLSDDEEISDNELNSDQQINNFLWHHPDWYLYSSNLLEKRLVHFQLDNGFNEAIVHSCKMLID